MIILIHHSSWPGNRYNATSRCTRAWNGIQLTGPVPLFLFFRVSTRLARGRRVVVVMVLAVAVRTWMQRS